MEVGGPQRPAVGEAPQLGGAEIARRALEDRHHLLVEGGDPHRRRAAGAVAQAGDQLADPAHLGGVAEGARGARIDQHVETADLLRHRVDRGGDPHHGEVAVAEAGLLAGPLLGDLEVAVGGPAALVQLHHPAVAHLAAEVARRGALGGAVAEQHADVQLADLGQAEEGEDVGLVGPHQGVRVGDDQLLAAARRDREDAGRELVAGLLLEQRRVLPAVEEVLVGLAGALALHHLPLLPAAVGLEREPRQRRARRQGDAEAAFDHPVAGVLEGQVQLGEGERRGEDAVGRQGDQVEPGAVRGGEADRGLRLGRRRAGGLGRPTGGTGRRRVPWWRRCGWRQLRAAVVRSLTGARGRDQRDGGDAQGGDGERAQGRGGARHGAASSAVARRDAGGEFRIPLDSPQGESVTSGADQPPRLAASAGRVVFPRFPCRGEPAHLISGYAGICSSLRTRDSRVAPSFRRASLRSYRDWRFSQNWAETPK